MWVWTEIYFDIKNLKKNLLYKNFEFLGIVVLSTSDSMVDY